MIIQHQQLPLHLIARQVNQIRFKDCSSSVTSVPSGNVHLIYSENSIKIKSPSFEMSLNEGIYLAGQQEEVIYYRYDGDLTKPVLIQMAPDGLKKFFGLQQQILAGKVISLEDVLGSQVRSLLEKLIQEKDVSLKKILLENFLLINLLKNTYRNDHSLHAVIDLIRKRKGDIRISSLAKEMSINKRNLERKFIEFTGISPKTFCKIIQFSGAFKKLISNTSIPDVLDDSGYYDQAHFINHFRKVMGISPAAFFKEEQGFFLQTKLSLEETEKIELGKESIYYL